MICPVYFHFNLDVSSQMALDQALFESLQEKKGAAFLRFYTIQPVALTVGYFINMGGHCEEPINLTGDEAISKPGLLPACRQAGAFARNDNQLLPIVKRLTGGGIVRHENDLVFSLGADCEQIPFLKNTSESYVAIHSVLQKAFQKEGIQAELVSCVKVKVPGTKGTANGKRFPLGTRYHSTICFQNPVPGDLMVQGQKVAGGAQKREKNFFLHQGSIQLCGLNPESFSKTLLDSFSENWDLDFRVDELSAELLKRARELAEERYQPLGEWVK